MPTEFESLMDRGMRTMEAGLPPDTIAIGAVSYPGVFSDLAIEDLAGLGGYTTDAVATFTIRRTAMATAPKTGAQVTRAGRVYKVGKVTTDTASHILELENPAKR